MSKFFALTGLGDIITLGEFDDFEDADMMAEDLGYDAVWIGDETTLNRWEKQIASIREIEQWKI